MTQELTLHKSIFIKASPTKVWRVLTDPELIKKYLFGTNTISDWKKGGPIIFKGEWEGKSYEDKGTILDIEKEKLIRYSYWSSMSGTEDKPENYNNVSYELKDAEGGTLFTLTQEGIKSDEALEHSDKSWTTILEGLRKVAED